MRPTDLFSVEGKVVVVTGGSRGIGEMIARGFVGAGARVWITSRKAADCEETAKALSELGECVPCPADLSRPDEVDRFVSEFSAREERLDVLVNNAGTNWAEPIDSYPLSGFDKVMTLNVRSVFHLTQALLPHLRKAATHDDPSRVIVIGSIDGIRTPVYENYAYSASKAAVHMLTRHMARTLAPEHVTVNAIAPGLFRTKMTRVFFEEGSDEPSSFADGAIPMGRVGRPEDLAGTAVWLASRSGSYLTGAVIPVDGGVSTTS